MTIFQTIFVALRSLGANKLRAALTVLGIIVGVAAVISLISVGQGAQQQITANIQNLGTNLLFSSPGYRSGRAVAAATERRRHPHL